MVVPAVPNAVEPDRGTRVDQLRETLIKLHLIAPAKLLDRSIRRLSFAGIKLLRSLARTPLIGGGLDSLLNRIDRHDRLHFELAEVLRVCEALSDQGVPYWVAGGWGLDALVGCQTRRHRDLDLVVHPFQESLPKVAAVLESLGYRRTTPLGGTLWFPDAEVYLDNRGHDVQVLNINWGVLTTVETLLNPTKTSKTSKTEPSNESTPVTRLLFEQFISSGVLEGVTMPTLSLTAQQLFHLGYPQRPEEPHAEDLIRLLSMGAGEWNNPLVSNEVRPPSQKSRQPSTLLLVPIFTFPPDLWRLCRLYHNDLMVPPHVTLAIPFRPLASVTAEIVAQLTGIFEETPAFDFELNDVRWFDTKVVYLEPSNADAFRSITMKLQDVFPDFHPYDGAFDSVIPHVTLSEHGSIADRRIVGRLAPKFTPIASRASHVWLMSNERGLDHWAIAKIFRLGAKTDEGLSNK